jgi:hypothetical protein
LTKRYACERDVAQCQGLKGWEAVRAPGVAVRAFGVVQPQAIVQLPWSIRFEREFEGFERGKPGRVVVEIGEGINDDIEVSMYVKRTKGR